MKDKDRFTKTAVFILKEHKLPLVGAVAGLGLKTYDIHKKEGVGTRFENLKGVGLYAGLGSAAGYGLHRLLFRK